MKITRRRTRIVTTNGKFQVQFLDHGTWVDYGDPVGGFWESILKADRCETGQAPA